MILWDGPEPVSVPAKAKPDIIDVVIGRLNRGVNIARMGTLSDRATSDADR